MSLPQSMSSTGTSPLARNAHPSKSLTKRSVYAWTRLYRSGDTVKNISTDFNIDPSYVRRLLAGKLGYQYMTARPEVLHVSQYKPSLRYSHLDSPSSQDFLIIQRLRKDNPHEPVINNDRRGNVPPLYPQIKALDIGYLRRTAKKQVS